MPALITVTDATFAEVVLTDPVPIVVDFWAEWCPPCGPMARVLAELAAESDPAVLRFAKINADENPEAARTYRIMSMPTLLLFQQGRVVKSVVGLRPRSFLRRELTGTTEAYSNQG